MVAERRIVDIKGPEKFQVTSTAYDSATNTLFYTTDNFTLRDLMALDVNTGKTRMLMANIRVGNLAYNAVDDALWGVRSVNGFAMLVRIPKPYDLWYEVYTFPYGEVCTGPGYLPGRHPAVRDGGGSQRQPIPASVPAG